MSLIWKSDKNSEIRQVVSDEFILVDIGQAEREPEKPKNKQKREENKSEERT